MNQKSSPQKRDLSKFQAQILFGGRVIPQAAVASERGTQVENQERAGIQRKGESSISGTILSRTEGWLLL